MAAPTPQYNLNNNGDFVITNYNSAKLFSSFFPGVAGQDGIPMWTFYVNRGQCICSMGIQDKEHAIMEFFPANRAYQIAASQGFRTFIKFTDGSGSFYEPFQNHFQDRALQRTQQMTVSPSRLTLEENNQSLGMTFLVEYCNVPNDDYAGLIRKLHIRNNSSKLITLDGLDGLSLIVPYGIDNSSLKFTRRLTEAFVEVVNLENKAPLFRGKVEPVDRPEVVKIKKGNFYIGFNTVCGQQQLVEPIVDPVKIFGSRSDYSYPEMFLNGDSEQITTDQILENRLPSAMGLFKAIIPAGETFTYTSIIGHSESVEELNSMVARVANNDYVEDKFSHDEKLIKALTQGHFICSNEDALDHYTRQNYLDNGLRGGFPITLGNGKKKTAFYMYSRKHGDLERDYNHFSLAPTKYSQGNANFRDINQNRRNDLYFNADIHDENVEHFYNLIQLDGFNPLVIKEVFFQANDPAAADKILASCFSGKDVQTVSRYVQTPFTPGLLLNWLKEQNIAPPEDSAHLIGSLLGVCDRITDTEHGEGFWTDHWTYNLDLLENYLAVYPEKKEHLLFRKKTFTYHDNAHRVLARQDKYVLWDDNPMQLSAVFHDPLKQSLIDCREDPSHLVRTEHGQGDIFHTTLFDKILCLIVNKISSLDPNGVGVEMESDKPNWYDALNGLPGVIGSSISETLEIKRNVLFLSATIEALQLENDSWRLFEELHSLLGRIKDLLSNDLSSFKFWDKAAAAKELYRAETKLGITGAESSISFKEIQYFLSLCLKKLDSGIEKAWDKKTGIISTYFINEVTDYEKLKIDNTTNADKVNEKGLTCYRATAFRQIPLPLFLEGPVHFLRTLPSPDEAKQIAGNIRNSGLYDNKLKMYKVNESLSDQPMEIGRARVFSPGWFENESIWLHMEYKYMLELLRNKLYDDFFRDFKDVFVPFFDPAIYGRSILENSSFIVSSANPDRSIHGNGFVARLSGATAEFINIMLLMTVGEKPFCTNDQGELLFNPSPALPEWLFTTKPQKQKLLRTGEWQDIEFSENSFSFMFMGQTLISYHNAKRKDTYGPESVNPTAITVTDNSGKQQHFNSGILSGGIAEQIRSGKIVSIDIELK